MPKFYDLKIETVNRETAKAISIKFEIPEHLRSEFRFDAGQYITIKTLLKGEEIRRDYSLCTNPRKEDIKVVVKEVENGFFSSYANSELSAGVKLEVGPPKGRFTFIPDPAKSRTIMAIAAGSGITPIMSILQSVLEDEPLSRFVLLYGNKSVEDTIFFKQLEELKDKYGNRFIYVKAYSQAPAPGSLFGRIDQSFILHTLKQLDEEKEVDCFYLCGPKPLIDESSRVLIKQGYPESKIKFELFTTTDSENRPESSGKVVEGMSDVEVVVDDETFTFSMGKDSTILEAALSHDIDAPYSCQGGICSSCLARIKEGSAEMRQNNILTDSEVAEGLILTCQAEPRSGKLIVDYDDV